MCTALVNTIIKTDALNFVKKLSLLYQNNLPVYFLSGTVIFSHYNIASVLRRRSSFAFKGQQCSLNRFTNFTAVPVNKRSIK